MIDDHEKLKEEIAAYALGVLDLFERSRVEAHLHDCPECLQLLREYQELLGLLPYGLQVTIPPPEVRETLLAQARSSFRSMRELSPSGHIVKPEARRPEPVSLVEEASGFWERLVGFIRPFRWAAGGIVLVGLLFWNIQLQLWNSQLQGRVAVLERSIGLEYLASLPVKQVIALKGTGAPEARARLYIRTDGQRGG